MGRLPLVRLLGWTLLSLSILSVGEVGRLAAQGAVAEEAPEAFPDAPHRETTFYFCTSCHNFKLTAAQGMSREKWDETLHWMTAKHNMPKLEGQDRSNTLDYLAAAFPPKAQGQPGGWKNPFGN
jgi:hypothetical protein